MSVGTYSRGQEEPPSRTMRLPATGRSRPTEDRRDVLLHQSDGLRANGTLRELDGRLDRTNLPSFLDPSGTGRSPGAVGMNATVPRAWRLYAKTFGLKVRMRATADGFRWDGQLHIYQARSPSEAYLLAVTAVLDGLCRHGAASVQVAGAEPVVEGYLLGGWTPRSIRMVLAIRALVSAAAGMSVVFCFPRPGRRVHLPSPVDD